jgi:uncharacterized protein (DUF2147 family)
MKRLVAIAAFLLASTAAQAQYTFEYGGRTIRIDPDRGTISIPGVYDNTPRRSKRLQSDQDVPRRRSHEQAKTEPQAPTPAPATSPAPAPAEPAPAAGQAKAPEAPTSTAKASPSDTAPPPPLPPVLPVPPVQAVQPAVQPVQPQLAAPLPPMTPQEEAPAAKLTPPPAAATAAGAPKPPVQVASPANSPLGLWLTEEKEGRIRIEQCGVNLCGYSVDQKSNQNAEQILINMKPGKDAKWSGRIFDPTTGSTYDSTIALRGSDTLRVQGCAFGGMFCGGQTWTRVN